ncbi:antibiotic biosynthesis monooxygenase [Mycobacterium sp. MYCO198283]|uniref:putative quinol monooxygenase n=1 Tax=Mycobacterium sp. MYCO198283 TaxID=2883505 RepID=UPI001E510677|nr:putative quinol monooxygenase [Mycobacterium sp. MYCO198283]MCG5433840.1 antibiotic biosynthesis monooxygenase [Mycobacterium sp. MYCO198283]
MPVVVVATLTVKPEAVDTVREVLTRTVPEVHDEPGCELYSLHEAEGGIFVFVEQWADGQALQTHSSAPAIGTMFSEIGDHLAGPPDIKVLQPVVAGDPAKGRLVAR